MADGSIRIDIDLQKDKFEKSLKATQAAAGRMQKKLEEMGKSIDSSMDAAQESVNQTAKAVNELGDLTEAEEKKMTSAVSKEGKKFQSLKGSMDKSSLAIESYKKKIAEVQKSLEADWSYKEIEKINSAFDKGQKEVDKYEQKLQEATAKAKELEAAAAEIENKAMDNNYIAYMAAKGSGASDKQARQEQREQAEGSLSKNKDYQKILSQLNQLDDAAERYGQALSNAERKQLEMVESAQFDVMAARQEKANSTVNTYSQKIKQAEATVNGLKDKVSTVAAAHQKNVSAAIGEVNASRQQEDAVKRNNSAVKRLAASVKNIDWKKGFGNGKKSIDTVTSAMQRAIKKAGKLALATVGIRSAYRAVSRAANAWLGEQTDLQNEITGLWATFGSVFEPIINGIVSLAKTAIGYLASFIKALTGVDIIAKRNANALNKQASATSAAADAQKEANKQLASFDEMNVLQDTSSSGSSGGSGGSSGLDSSIIDINPDEFSNKFLKQIEDAIKNEDWYGVGKGIADGLNYAMYSIDWEKVKATAREKATNIGEGFNGFIENFDWYKMGSNIMEGINTAITFVGSLIGTINWKELGKGIGDSIRGAIDSIDTDAWSDAITNIVTGVFDLLDGFILGLDNSNTTNTLFDKLKEIIEKIDYKKIAKSLGNLLWDAVYQSLLTAFFNPLSLASLIVDAFLPTEEDKQKAYDKFVEVSQRILDGLGIHIPDEGWVREHIVDPFISAVKGLLGIHSPSTVFAEIGENIIDGLANGVSGIWDKTKQTWEDFKTKTAAKFEETKNKAKEKFSVDAMKTHFQNVVSGIKGKFSYENMQQWFSDKFESVKNRIKSAISVNAMKEHFENVRRAIYDKFSNLGEKIGSVISDKFKTAINSMLRMVETNLNKAISFINGAIDIMNKVPGVKIGHVSKLSLPRLATGGIVNSPTLAQIGEAGREAVVPLTNRAAMQELGAIIGSYVNGGGTVTIPIYLGSKLIAKEIVDIQNRKEFATNGGAW